MRHLAIVATAALTLAAAGCVERKLTVISNPPGARVYLDGEERGITPVTFRFDWYGKREFTLRKDGYRTLREVRDVHEPFYERPVINVVSDLSPLPISDHKTVTFDLEPVRKVDPQALLDRANEMKYRLEGRPIPARVRPEVPPSDNVTRPLEPKPGDLAPEPRTPEPKPDLRDDERPTEPPATP